MPSQMIPIKSITLAGGNRENINPADLKGLAKTKKVDGTRASA